MHWERTPGGAQAKLAWIKIGMVSF